MTIRWRPVRSTDVLECVQIVASHPVQASRYGNALQDLRKFWEALLSREAFRAIVFEETERESRLRTVGVGVSVFISGDFLNHIKTPPHSWVYPELMHWETKGRFPILSNKQTRESNASGGLNLLVLENTFRPEYENRLDTHAAIYAAFLEQHRGFLLKELICHSMSQERLQGLLHSGGQLLDGHGKYVDGYPQHPGEVFENPHFIGLTREAALSRLGSWLGFLFVHELPRFALRPSEQRLLLAALHGWTDEELAAELGVSLSAVKKTWSHIYERASACLPDLSPHPEPNCGAGRGKEKKQRLLSYLREHPEELRPASP